MESPIKDLFLSPGFPSSLLPVLAELKAGCALLKAWLATLEQSESRTGLGPLKQPQQRGHPLLRDMPHGAGPATRRAKPACNVGQAGERQQWKRSHWAELTAASHGSWAFREETVSSNGLLWAPNPSRCLPEGQPSFPSRLQLAYQRKCLQCNMLFASDLLAVFEVLAIFSHILTI